ncbi:MAG TPA: isochorismatase family protein [Spirochaetes bacterium]|nr:isochorismatase family protein [Spirochaetota bacterium]
MLLVIDPQNDVLDEKGSLSFWQVWKHAAENRSVENIRRIIPACRKANIPVIWAKQYRLEKGRDVFPGTWDGDSLTLIRTLLPDGFMENTWETEIHRDLAAYVDEKDIVIGKHGSSMFEGTALEKYLRNLGARVLIVTGFLTDFCIEGTVRSACDRGYLAVTVSDGCATQNEDLHRDALQRMRRLIGPVIDTDGILELVGKSSVNPLPSVQRGFTVEEIGKKMAEGLSLNDIVDWKRYLKKETSALLVIDPQNDNLHEKGSFSFTGSWKAAKESGAVERLRELVSACREARVPVFWIRQNRLTGGKDIFPGTFDRQVMDVVQQAVPGAFLSGSWDTDFFEDIKPLIGDDEMVIEKAAWSAFESTPLERYLNHLGVTGIIVCGFLTDFCVEATVRNASDRGYFSIIVSDACAAATEKDHGLALARFDRLIGPVVDAKSIIGFLMK